MIRLTPDRVRQWHRLEKRRHAQNGQDRAPHCIICAWEGGGVPWAAVVRHIERQGFKILQWAEGWADVDTGPWHEENQLYHAISGHGNWI